MVMKLELDLFSSYVAHIEWSVGSNAHRKLYFFIDSKSVDILDDGDLSCAMFVTRVLTSFDLIREKHATVEGSLRDIKASGWFVISKPRKGALVHWGVLKKKDGTLGKHQHLGFYIDETTAISNDPETRVPIRHHPTYGTSTDGEDRREILDIYWHEKLN